MLKFLNCFDCCKNSFFSTFVSLSWPHYDSLVGDLEKCSRLPKLMLQLTGNLTYFRAALTWLRMSEAELQQHKLPHGFGEEMIHYGNWRCVLGGRISSMLQTGKLPSPWVGFGGNSACLGKDLDVKIWRNV